MGNRQLSGRHCQYLLTISRERSLDIAPLRQAVEVERIRRRVPERDIELRHSLHHILQD